MSSRFAFALLAVLAFGACDDAPPPDSKTSASPPRCGNVVWSADHETGDLSQWYTSDGGGEFNSGAAESSPSQDVAHSGRYSAKMTIGTPHVPVTSGVRLFRWKESHANPEACYSAWYYFPQRYIVPVWWNIFAFKSRSGTTLNDPFWSLEVANRSSGAMFVYLNWWEGLSIEGPHQGESGNRSYSQTLMDIPVGRWTHVQLYVKQSSEFDGQIIVWQDDVELINVNRIRTRYAAVNGANEWLLANYSDSIVPSPTTIYIDDATIRSVAAGLSPVGAVAANR